MDFAILIYTIYSFYLIMCWVGFLFVLKIFDYVESQIKGAFLPFVATTIMSVTGLYFLVFNPPTNKAMIHFMLLPISLVVLCSIIPPTVRGLTEFRLNQKRKRGL